MEMRRGTMDILPAKKRKHPYSPNVPDTTYFTKFWVDPGSVPDSTRHCTYITKFWVDPSVPEIEPILQSFGWILVYQTLYLFYKVLGRS